MGWLQHSTLANSRRNMMAPVGELMQHLLQLPEDDPRFARIAGAAELVVCKEREGIGRIWSTPEMEAQLTEVRQLEAAWRTFNNCGHSPSDALLDRAGLHLVFLQFVADVREGRPVAEHVDLLLRVARWLLGVHFECKLGLESYVAEMVSGSGGAGSTDSTGMLSGPVLSKVEAVLSCLADRQSALGDVNSLSRG